MILPLKYISLKRSKNISQNINPIPLAQKLRPKSLSDFVGQAHLLGTGLPLANAINTKQLHSLLLWGEPGCGKTTLAGLISQHIEADFVQLSAASDGVKSIKAVIQSAQSSQKLGRQLLLFVDEVHRFNKAQQDVLLPHIESGLILFIGATTQNPAFEINPALLSRVTVYRLKKLSIDALSSILSKASKTQNIQLEPEAQTTLLNFANGDARRLLNYVQLLPKQTRPINLQDIAPILDNKVASFDKGGDNFYQQLSAFHKSVRGSSPDGALYWFARMVGSGCDAKIIARRLLAIASEDIGNADPKALEITLNAWDIYHRVGDKEGLRAIAQAVVYCAIAAKSNALYLAWNTAQEHAKQTNHSSVPKHLCNAPTQFDKQAGLGADYRYAHNEPDALAKGQTYFPDELGEQAYYQPTNRGLEAKISQRLKQLRSTASSKKI